jgi:hypothetical protein
LLAFAPMAAWAPSRCWRIDGRYHRTRSAQDHVDLAMFSSLIPPSCGCRAGGSPLFRLDPMRTTGRGSPRRRTRTRRARIRRSASGSCTDAEKEQRERCHQFLEARRQTPLRRSLTAARGFALRAQCRLRVNLVDFVTSAICPVSGRFRK